MYKTVDSCGALLARIVRGNVTVGYLFKDYDNRNKYPITKESAQCMAGSDSLWIIVNNTEQHMYLDDANRIRSEGKLKMKDLPVIKEADLIKKIKSNNKINIEQLPDVLKSGYNSWYTNVCCRQDKYINITDVTWRLDTYLSEQICLTLGMHNEDFKETYEKYGCFSSDGKYFINMADEAVYSDLVRVIKRFKKDYQIKDFLKYLLDAINSI